MTIEEITNELRRCASCVETAALLIEEQEVALAAARDPRWIPVTERLPKPFESVLLYMPNEAPLPTVHEGYVDREGDWHRLSVFGAACRVTHWMPMPSAPEEG